MDTKGTGTKQTAGIAMDRENIGGNQSGQQSNYVSRGGNPDHNKWSLDGVDITDMAATVASPSYYDFDSFEEMTISTGGVGISLVTKSGTDKFRGSSRFFETNHKFESQNITDTQRTQGATSGNPIQNIKDYGLELGGPIKKGRAWVWGSIGKTNVGVGVLNFYQPSANCQAFKDKATALAVPIADVNNCLNTDLTALTQSNLKAEVQLFMGNNFVLDFHSPELSTVEPTFIISNSLNGRSGGQSVFLRPVNSVNLNANYFLPAKMGGGHALEIGGYWRDSNTSSFSHRGGYGTVRFPTSETNDCSTQSTGCQVDLVRDGLSRYHLNNISAFAQDTYTGV